MEANPERHSEDRRERRFGADRHSNVPGSERSLLEDILNGISTAIGYLDRNGIFRFANKATAEMLGVPKESIVGKSFADLGRGDHHVHQEVASALETGSPRTLRLDLASSGHDAHFSITIRPDVSESGEIRGLFMEALDISDSVHAQERTAEERGALRHAVEARTTELRESQQRLDAIILASPLAIYTLNPDATVGRWNPAAERIFGWTEKEVRGKRLPNILESKMKDPSSAIKRELRGEAFAGVETQRFRKDGSIIDASVSAAPLYSQAGEFVGTMAIVEDITERKRMQKAIEEIDRTIRQVYADVTGAVTGGKLILMTPEEIERALGEPVSDEYYVGKPEELSEARHRLKEVLVREFPEIMEFVDFIDPFGEALTNAVKHAGGGSFRLYRHNGTVQIVVSDKGPGIDFATLPKATLQLGYSTVGTLGRGFSVMLGRCDRVLLATQPGNTTVVLEVGAEKVL